MNRQQFKETYLINAFFWINQSSYLKIQEILNEFGFKCHTGFGIIQWHDGFKNLVTFPKDKEHDFEYYQKTDFWHPSASYGIAKNYEDMVADYNVIESV